MARIFAVLACIAFAALATGVEIEKVEEIEAVQVVKDINEYIEQNPGVELVPLTAEISPLGVLRYTIGRRVTGDRLVGQVNETVSERTYQTIQLLVLYPEFGVTGEVLTYCEVLVDQSSMSGKAQVLSGGIGHRKMTILLVAEDSKHLSYNAKFYGH